MEDNDDLRREGKCVSFLAFYVTVKALTNNDSSRDMTIACASVVQWNSKGRLQLLLLEWIVSCRCTSIFLEEKIWSTHPFLALAYWMIDGWDWTEFLLHIKLATEDLLCLLYPRFPRKPRVLQFFPFHLSLLFN